MKRPDFDKSDCTKNKTESITYKQTYLSRPLVNFKVLIMQMLA